MPWSLILAAAIHVLKHAPELVDAVETFVQSVHEKRPADPMQIAALRTAIDAVRS